MGNKRYFLESEVCRGHLTRKQHCNLDSEWGSLINIQTTCHLLVSPHLALGLSCRGLTKMGSYLEDYYRRYNENISRWPGYSLDQLSIFIYIYLQNLSKPRQEAGRGRLARSVSQWDVQEASPRTSTGLHSASSWDLNRPQTTASAASSFNSPPPYHVPYHFLCSTSEIPLHIRITGSGYWRIQIPSQNVMCPLIFVMFSNLQSPSRRWKKDREEWNLANGINFSYTSPYMADNCSIVKT